MSIISHNQRLVNDEKTFRLWVELGSINKVSELYRKEGIVNPKSGKQFSQMALWTAATRYAIEHPEISKPIYDEENGVPISEKDWELWRIYKAFKVYSYSRKRCIAWARRFDLYPKYKELFDRTLATFHIDREPEEEEVEDD